MRNADDRELTDEMISILDQNESTQDLQEKITEEKREKIISIMPELKERAKTLVELAIGTEFILNNRPLNLNAKAEKLMTDDAKALLKQLSIQLEHVDNWNIHEIETTIRDFSTQNDIKLGKVAQPLRAALTGTNVSPGIFDVLAVLGRDETLGRLSDSIGADS